MDFSYAPGATPLDPEEAVGLIPAHIATQGDLNAWEEANIVEAAHWATRAKKADPLTEGFVLELHRRMFDKTWRWAGAFRRSNKNIGVDWTQVAVSLRQLLDDVRYQIGNRVFEEDELALRFHQRLVWIHLFPNGNGRHARLMADVLATRLGRPVFSWGAARVLAKVGAARRDYLDALRKADQGHFADLLDFARR